MSNQKPVISVVVCSYNRIKSVTKAIDSVLNQKGDFDLEVLIGDDGSTDGSRDLILDYQKKYPDQIIPVFHKNNLGLGGNWATLAKQASGKYLASCDDDDYWHDENKLQKQIEFFEKNPDYGVIYTNYRTYHVKTKKTKEVIVNNQLNGLTLTKAIFTGKHPMVVSSTLIRKELTDMYIPYDDYVKNRFTVQDWPTWIILSNYTKFKHLTDSTTTYSIGAESITLPKSYEYITTRFGYEKVMYQYLCNLFPKQLPFDENGYDAYVQKVFLKLAFRKLDYRNGKKFAGNIKKLGRKNKYVQYASNPFFFYLFAMYYKLKNNL